MWLWQCFHCLLHTEGWKPGCQILSGQSTTSSAVYTLPYRSPDIRPRRQADGAQALHNGGGDAGRRGHVSRGYDNEHYLCCRVLKFLLDSTPTGKHMAHKRFTTAAATLGGAIYVPGGYDNQRYLAAVERFDAREGRWGEVAPMAQKRGAHACTAASGHLIAIGGWDGAK